jgi:hypothetical protein
MGPLGFHISLAWSEKRSVIVVRTVDPNASVAQQLRKGDIISEINGIRPRTCGGAAQLISEIDGLLELTVRTTGLLYPTCPGPVPSRAKPPPVLQLTRASFSYHLGSGRRKKAQPGRKARPVARLTSATPVLTRVHSPSAPLHTNAILTGQAHRCTMRVPTACLRSRRHARARTQSAAHDAAMRRLSLLAGGPHPHARLEDCGDRPFWLRKDDSDEAPCTPVPGTTPVGTPRVTHTPLSSFPQHPRALLMRTTRSRCLCASRPTARSASSASPSTRSNCRTSSSTSSRSLRYDVRPPTRRSPPMDTASRFEVNSLQCAIAPTPPAHVSRLHGRTLWARLAGDGRYVAFQPDDRPRRRADDECSAYGRTLHPRGPRESRPCRVCIHTQPPAALSVGCAPAPMGDTARRGVPELDHRRRGARHRFAAAPRRS